MLLGAAVGWEREFADKPPGLRTHMMVCLGAASFTLVGSAVFREIAAGSATSSGMDPIRVIEGVVTGIGFLGAGVILRSGEQVRGLTTASGVWVVGAIGTACGRGYYLLAAARTVLALVILQLVSRLEHRVRGTKATGDLD